MSLVSSLEEYRKYLKNSKEIKKDKYLSYLSVVIFCVALSGAIYFLFLDKPTISLAILGVSGFYNFIGFKLDKRISLLRRIRKSVPYTGSLYDIFDRNCSYSQEVLNIQSQKIKNDIIENKGLSGKIILFLEQEIQHLKYIASNEKTVRFYQDIYYLIKGEAKSRSLVEGNKRAKICYQIDPHGSKDNISFSFIFYLFITLITILLTSFCIINSIKRDDLSLIITQGSIIVLSGLALSLMIYAIKYLPWNKLSNKSLYDIIDGSKPETKIIINKNLCALVSTYKNNNGFTKFNMCLFKNAFKFDAKNQKGTLDKVDEEILVSNGTKLGNLLSEVNNLK